MRVDVAGTQINYELSGQGPVLVLTHGLGGSLEAWQPLADALDDRHRVLRWDVRGFGQSDRSGPLSPEVWAQDLAGLLDALSIDEAVVAGISMGGVIAQRFALDFPQRTRGLVLMSTSSEVGEAGRSGWESRAALVEREGMAALMKESGGPSISYSKDYAASHVAEIAEAAEVTAARNDPACYAAACRAVSDYSYTEDLAQIERPTLIVQGLEDQLTPPGGSVIMSRRISGSRLEFIEGCGHGIPAEQPERLAELLGVFLAELD